MHTAIMSRYAHTRAFPNMTELKKFKEPGHFARFSKEQFNDIAGITP